MARGPSDAAPGQLDLGALARCHLLCLPQTASSRAGLTVLRGLYEALLSDAAAHVIWHPGEGAAGHEGGFASGTVRYRDTERLTRKALPKLAFARLALQAARSPQHVLARRNWEQLIPLASIGYVLTLGTARAVASNPNAPRGASLLSELESWFRTQGCEASFTDTELANERAHAFYLRAGYEEVSRDFGQVLLQKRFAPAGSAS